MQTNLPAIILVHGAWHGAWCWERMTPLLAAKGYRVVAPDLPVNSEHKKIGMQDYAEAIAALVQAESQPVILVGHSMAGIIISQVAEWVPEKIHELIYLSAYVPANGDSLFGLAQSATNHYLRPYLHFDEVNNEISLDKVPAVEEVFAQLCTKADQALAISRLSKQPMKAFADTVSLGTGFESVAKRAIIGEHDKAIAAVDQVRMAEKSGAVLRFIPADHSPFYACPEVCVNALLQ
ncbi:MAG TPA: alpha/beta fold hydrolase [Gammaproteobacteria bacterium]|jgi:pimeloyl-ACP methyl ester carboxylesterase|nr:alpha/beta fold hydrolase [Gammaproteobacteria bacterium]